MTYYNLLQPNIISIFAFSQVPTAKLHIFTLIQLVCLGFLWGVKSTPIVNMFFPLFLILSVLLRNFVLPACTCLFTPEHLDALDGEHNDNEYKARTGDPLIGSDHSAGPIPITPEDISTFPATSPSGPTEGPNDIGISLGSDSPPLRFAMDVPGAQPATLPAKKRSNVMLLLHNTSDDYDDDLADEDTEPGLIRGRDSELSLNEMGPLYISATPPKRKNTASDHQMHLQEHQYQQHDSSTHLEPPHTRSRPVSISIAQLEHHPPHQSVSSEAMSLVAFHLGDPEPVADALQPLLDSESNAATPGSDHEELDFYEQAHMPM